MSVRAVRLTSGMASAYYAAGAALDRGGWDVEIATERAGVGWIPRTAVLIGSIAGRARAGPGQRRCGEGASRARARARATASLRRCVPSFV